MLCVLSEKTFSIAFHALRGSKAELVTAGSGASERKRTKERRKAKGSERRRTFGGARCRRVMSLGRRRHLEKSNISINCTTLLQRRHSYRRQALYLQNFLMCKLHICEWILMRCLCFEASRRQALISALETAAALQSGSASALSRCLSLMTDIIRKGM